MDRQRLLFLIVVLLLALRFIVVPSYQHLQTLEQDNAEKRERLDKSVAFLASETQLQEANRQMDITLDQLESVFPSMADSNAAKLEFQRQVQDVAQKHNITLESIEWGATINGQPVRTELILRIKSRMKDLAAFQFDLQKMGTWLALKQMEFRVDGQNIGWKQLGQARGQLHFNVYYVVKASS